MAWLAAYLGFGVLCLLYSAASGKSARRMFSDIESFYMHVGAMVLWPSVFVVELVGHIRQVRWERKNGVRG